MTKFTISRTFDAPQRTVFDYWVTPEHFVQWSGPAGCKSTLVHADVRPGGYYLERQNYDDAEIYVKHDFRKIQPHDELVYVGYFSTETGDPAQHPFVENWPDYLLTTVRFDDLGKQTRVTVEWEPIEASQAQDRQFAAYLSSCHAGWSETFDKLEELFGVKA